jgi:hypothetical protein
MKTYSKFVDYYLYSTMYKPVRVLLFWEQLANNK